MIAPSCVHMGDLNLDPIPDITFDLIHVSGNDYQLVNTTQGATNVSWEIIIFDSGSLQTVLSGTGDVYDFTFPAIGSYWIKMTATHSGWEQTIYTTKFVDKSSCIKLDDDSFDDWNGITTEAFKMYGRNVNTPEAEREGPCYMVEGNLDYDSDNIYMYVVVDSNDGRYKMGGMDGGDGGNEFIIFINADGDMGTTSPDQSSEGYEWLVEFKFWGDESEVGFVGTSDEYGGWDGLKGGDALVPSFKFGTTKEIDGKYYFEFALDRHMLGITKSKFGCQMSLTQDWDTCDYLWDANQKVDMVFNLVAE